MRRIGLLHGFEARFALGGPQGILLESDWIHNDLLNEGEKSVILTYLLNQSAPAQFFVRLFGDTPAETDSLASLANEPGGSQGYAQQLIERSSVGWPTQTEVGGDFEVRSKTVRFQCTGGIWPTVTHAVLATTSDNTGKLVDKVQLPTPAALSSGGFVDIAYRVRQT